MAAVGEPGEVVGALVDLLEERRVRVDDAAGAEHAVDLVRDDGRLQHVLQHRLDDDAVDAAVRERDRVTVADELGRGAGVDVERDEIDRRVVVQLLEAVTDRATADHQDAGVAVGGVGLEQLLHPRDVRRRGGVGRVQQPAQRSGGPRALHLGGALDRAQPVRVEHAGVEVDQRGDAGHDRERLVGIGAASSDAVPLAVHSAHATATPWADEEVLVDHRVEGEHGAKPKSRARLPRGSAGVVVGGP